MSHDLSIVVHGQIREETQSAIDRIAKIFHKDELILSVSENDENYKNLVINNKFKVIRYKEPGQFQDYGFFSRNYLKHIYGAKAGIEASHGHSILKVRSDIIINKINITQIKQKKIFNYFHYTADVSPIYVYPFYRNLNFMNGDMIVYGNKEELKLLFKSENKCDYINLSNTSIFPNNLPSISESYLTPEEIMYISYVKNLLSKNETLSFDEVLGNLNHSFIDLSEIILKLEVECKLPRRIEQYIFGYKGQLNTKLRYSKLYRKFYELYKTIKVKV